MPGELTPQPPGGGYRFSRPQGRDRSTAAPQARV